MPSCSGRDPMTSSQFHFRRGDDPRRGGAARPGGQLADRRLPAGMDQPAVERRLARHVARQTPAAGIEAGGHFHLGFLPRPSRPAAGRTSASARRRNRGVRRGRRPRSGRRCSRPAIPGRNRRIAPRRCNAASSVIASLRAAALARPALARRLLGRRRLGRCCGASRRFVPQCQAIVQPMPSPMAAPIQPVPAQNNAHRRRRPTPTR